MLVTALGIFTLVRTLQSRNALVPMLVTLFPITTFLMSSLESYHGASDNSQLDIAPVPLMVRMLSAESFHVRLIPHVPEAITSADAWGVDNSNSTADNSMVKECLFIIVWPLLNKVLTNVSKV